MTHSSDSVELALRREALLLSLQGARASVPMLWIAVAIVAWPGWDYPGAWPLWWVGSLALISGLWRLWFVHLLQRPAPQLELARLNACEMQVQANAALSGLMWASATLILYPGLSAEQAALHTCVLIGAVSVASYYMSLIGRSFELIAVPMMGALAVVAWWRHSPQATPIIIGCIVFLVAMLRATQHFRASAKLSLRRGLEMAALNRYLEAESSAKARFLVTMGQELRRPMSGIQGALDLLQHEALGAGARGLVQTAQGSANELLQAVTALLDYSRLEAQPPTPSLQPVDIKALCRDLVEQRQGWARDKHLDLACWLDSEVPTSVMTDPDCLRQVLGRLLDNALKFTERGRVELRLSAPSSGALRFELTDTGIGIAEADQRVLFQPFHQIDHGPQRAHGGSGLGLATAQRLVQALGARIEVQSRPGHGSRFSFELQLSPALAPASASVVPLAPVPSSAAQALQGTVLVVEDDPANRMILAEMVGRSGLNVVEATDGLQALDALHHGGIDLVLMDGQMPQLDGYEATRQWRGLESRLGLPRVPVIAVSANTLPGDVQLALDSGMDDHLPKPFGMNELMDRVAHWLPQRPGHLDQGATATQ